jgi:hypothetical protein
MEEILTYILKFDDASTNFQLQLNVLLQKLIHLSDLNSLKLSSILLLFAKLNPLLQDSSKEPVCLQFLSILNNVLILCLERREFSQIWSFYITQIDLPNK